MLLGTFAIVITLTMPKGIAGLSAERFDLALFPLRRRVHFPEQKGKDSAGSPLANALEGSRAPEEPGAGSREPGVRIRNMECAVKDVSS
jgi:hypothetical protein